MSFELLLLIPSLRSGEGERASALRVSRTSGESLNWCIERESILPPPRHGTRYAADEEGRMGRTCSVNQQRASKEQRKQRGAGVWVEALRSTHAVHTLLRWRMLQAHRREGGEEEHDNAKRPEVNAGK